MKVSLEWNFGELTFKKEKITTDGHAFAAKNVQNYILVGQQ